MPDRLCRGSREAPRRTAGPARAHVRDCTAGAGQRDQPRDRRGGNAAGGQCARSAGGRGDPAPAGRRRQTGRAVSAARRAGGQRATRQRSSGRGDQHVGPRPADRRGAGRPRRRRWCAADRFAQLRPAGAAGCADGRRAGGVGPGRGLGRDHAHAAWRLELPAARRRGRSGAGQGRRSLDHRVGQTGAGKHRIALGRAAEVRHDGGAGAVRRDARTGWGTPRRRKGAGGRPVRGAAVAAVRAAADRPGPAERPRATPPG